jgi:predicted phosphoribosyltransferase
MCSSSVPLGVPGHEELARGAIATGGVIVVNEIARAQALRRHEPARAIIAVPTAPPEAREALKAEADEIICAMTPESFSAVGSWYEECSQTTDDEVRDLLEASSRAE